MVLRSSLIGDPVRLTPCNQARYVVCCPKADQRVG
jgi:hypothetical protein